ncbi:MAG: FliM/FliN family flagellar motor switch protein [Pseudomonadales bacterium]|nr:FliM/FliN family flagellar motor switch protein [Pseudomonadales bacterium]
MLEEQEMIPTLDEINDRGKTTEHDVLNELPIDISFKLGAVTLSLKELVAMQEGFIFELPQRIDQLQTQVLANGKRIGRGELVAIGDMLGVRLKEIDRDGVK